MTIAVTYAPDKNLGLNGNRTYSLTGIHSFFRSLKCMNFHIFTFISSLRIHKLTSSRLIAQSVEYCTGAEVMASNPVQAWIFCRLSLISQLLKLRIWLRWSFTYSFFLPQFKRVNFHIFPFIVKVRQENVHWLWTVLLSVL